LHEALLGF